MTIKEKKQVDASVGGRGVVDMRKNTTVAIRHWADAGDHSWRQAAIQRASFGILPLFAGLIAARWA
jgi:kynureninase